MAEMHRNALFDLDGRVAVVVGAAPGGLGITAAQALVENGASVVVADLACRKGELGALAKERKGVFALTCDVTSELSVNALIDASIERLGRIDILVNAAGLMLRKPAKEMALPEWSRVIETNLTGAWLLTRAVADPMASQQYGRIVHFSSVYAERAGRMPESAYYAAKAGVANLTRAMAVELAPLGVTVNCLAPGVFFPTGMTAALSADESAMHWLSERTLLKRFGDPDRDLAGPLLLLASDAGGYITGSVMYVDGGWSAW